jgi:hypothetical protein
MSDAIFRDKAIVPWELSHYEYEEVLRLLAQQKKIRFESYHGMKTIAKYRN